MKRIAVVLSGCGFQDGTEITEAISCFLALTEKGATYQCFAPDIHFQPLNHLTGKPEGELRSVLLESARLNRGKCLNISNLDSENFDGLLFPGGFGAAKTLSNWAEKGAEAVLNQYVSETIHSFYKTSKPIAAACIAPTLLALVLGSREISLTIGTDQKTAQEIEKTGAKHIPCTVTEYISDRDHKILTTPAYMMEAPPIEIYNGIHKMITELVEMA